MLQADSKPVSAATDDEERRSQMLCGGFGEEKLSEKMGAVEGDDDSWTLDCLRRRLLAERASSRVAKEDAEFMGRKLIELESQLKLEIKARDRAEKMLKFATKRLESLNNSAASSHSSSPASEGHCGSSSTSSSSLQEPDERSIPQKEMGKCKTEERIEHVPNSSLSLSEDFRCKNPAPAADAVNQVPSHEQSPASSARTADSRNNEDGSEEDANEFIKDSLSSRQSMNDAFRHSPAGREEVAPEQDRIEYADNALAIVPVNMWHESKDSESQSTDINEVLLALRHAKEHLQSSIRIRSSACSKSVGLCGM